MQTPLFFLLFSSQKKKCEFVTKKASYPTCFSELLRISSLIVYLSKGVSFIRFISYSIKLEIDWMERVKAKRDALLFHLFVFECVFCSCGSKTWITEYTFGVILVGFEYIVVGWIMVWMYHLHDDNVPKKTLVQYTYTRCQCLSISIFSTFTF